MKAYQIPIRYLPFEKQIKAARLLHLLVAFLFLLNAWIDFNQPNPSAFFVITQIACFILIFIYVLLGKHLISSPKKAHFIFRVVEVLAGLYASWYFLSFLNLPFQSTLSVITVLGLFYLLLMERNLFKEVFLTLDEKGIRLPSFGKTRQIPWAQVDQMRIRNDFISINTKDNRFLQYEISQVLTDTSIDEMNAWCLQRYTSS